MDVESLPLTCFPPSAQVSIALGEQMSGQLIAAMPVSLVRIRIPSYSAVSYTKRCPGKLLKRLCFVCMCFVPTNLWTKVNILLPTRNGNVSTAALNDRLISHHS